MPNEVGGLTHLSRTPQRQRGRAATAQQDTGLQTVSVTTDNMVDIKLTLSFNITLQFTTQ